VQACGSVNAAGAHTCAGLPSCGLLDFGCLQRRIRALRRRVNGLCVWMLKSLRAFLAAQWLTIRVVGTFVVLIAVFFSVLTYSPIVERIDIGEMMAQLSAWLSWLFLKGLGSIVGFPVVRDGKNIGSTGFAVEVSPACSGAVPTMIYLAAVFAYPTTVRAKAIGAAMGAAIIHAVNLLRVITLFLIGLFAHQYFHDTHVYVAQALVVCIAVATWLFWAGRFADAPGR
jgi:exosortase/archaeosortase family protein